VPSGTPVGGRSGSSAFGGATAVAPESGALIDEKSEDEFNSGGVNGRGAMSEVAGG